MTTANLGGASALERSSLWARQIDNKKPEGGKKTADDVLAYLRELMPGWTITTNSAEWGEGFRNIEIDREILQRMADDPKEMEKYKALLLSFEDAVEGLEQWGKENPDQSVVFGISLDAEGNATAMAVVKTLLGVEKSSTFDLPSDRSSWAEFMKERLEALSQGQVEDATGSKSWIA